VTLSPDRVALMTSLRLGTNPYVPVFPNEAQAVFLLSTNSEVLFGGSAGGGKTFAILMDALADVETPGYAALLIRKSFMDLSLPGCLIPISHEWLGSTKAKWNGSESRWTFPSGASLSFGYLSDPTDHLRYQGSQLSMIGVDELTQHRELQYRYLFSRLRRPESGPLSRVRLRMRSTSNPGGDGHEWVKRDFMDSPWNADTNERRLFIPARLADNPKLDVEAYRKSLARLDPVTRKQLEDGDWTARHGGSFFKREWFRIVDAIPGTTLARVRAWDLAASEAPEAKRTAGVRAAKAQDGRMYVDDVVVGRWTPGERDRVIRETAERDGKGVRVVIEQEPGSGGIAQVEALVRLLRGYRCEGVRPTGDKFVRAGPVASSAQIGDVRLVRGGWSLSGLLDELEAVNPQGTPGKQLLDQMDALSSAYDALLLTPTMPNLPPRLADRARTVLDDSALSSPW